MDKKTIEQYTLYPRLDAYKNIYEYETLRDVSLNIKTANKLLDMECLAPAWLKSLNKKIHMKDDIINE